MANEIQNILIDINDIPNLNPERNTLVAELSNKVRAALTESQDAGELFLQSLNDVDRFLADGTLNEDLAVDDVDHMNEYEQADYIWCYLAANLRMFASTDEGKHALSELGINLTWDL